MSVMEKAASTVTFPCKYSTSGCSESLLHTEKGKHEETCKFRPYSCPCPRISCKWQGSLEQVVPHLDMSHASVVNLQGEDITFVATNVNLSEAMDWAMIQSCFGHHFLLVLQKYRKFLVGQQHFFGIVQLIRSRKEAEKFSYKLELNGQRRRLTWQATPRSIREEVFSAIMKTDGLFLDNNTAQHFIDNGNLVIEVTISMVSD